MTNKTIIAVCLLCVFAALTGCGRPDPAPTVVAAPKKDTVTPPVVTPPEKEPAKLPPVVPPPVVPLLNEKKPEPVAPKPPVVKKERVKPTETVSLTAEAFGNELRKNPEAARKFETVFIELSGVVRHVGSRDKEPYVTLDAGSETLGVMCLLAKEKEPWAKISKGQKIKVRGAWPEFFVQPALEMCELIEVGPNPAQELKAEALAEEFAKARDAVRAKYQEKPLIVTGILEDRTRNELGAVRLFLKGSGGIRVDCGFNVAERGEAEAAGFGQRVRLVGEFSAVESGEGPALRGCRIIHEK